MAHGESVQPLQSVKNYYNSRAHGHEWPQNIYEIDDTNDTDDEDAH